MSFRSLNLYDDAILHDDRHIAELQAFERCADLIQR